MTDPTHHLGAALGRIPSGIYILTTGCDGQTTGMLASWVQQAGFDPLMVTVAVRRDRYIADWIAASRRFTLNQVAAGNKSLLKHFSRGFLPDENAFDGLALREATPTGPVLADAMAYLTAEIEAWIDGGDHRIFLAKAIKGE